MKLTDVLDFYEIKVRMCANGSKMIQEQDFTVSYVPTVDADSFRLAIEIAVSDEMIIVFIDVSNVFQTNDISYPNKRIYITLKNSFDASMKISIILSDAAIEIASLNESASTVGTYDTVKYCPCIIFDPLAHILTFIL